jgi:hypothetical protein
MMPLSLSVMRGLCVYPLDVLLWSRPTVLHAKFCCGGGGDCVLLLLLLWLLLGVVCGSGGGGAGPITDAAGSALVRC